MSALRVLNVDDESDIREIVEISLGLDPEMTVRSCASGGEAIAAAAGWSPDLILLDVMMPGMDGPATLARLRESPRTAAIPVVFMTARTQPRDVEHFRALGAKGVIAKPFDPITLAASVRSHMEPHCSSLAEFRERFLKRARADVDTLTRDWLALTDEAIATAALERIKVIAHRLAGGGGIVGFAEVSTKAQALEQTAIAALDGTATIANVERTLCALFETVEYA